ncbi:Serpin 42Da [Carabus blaptoides fortunei]
MVSFILLFAMATCALANPAENVEKAIGRSSEIFAARVYEDIKNTKEGNLLICPLSVQTVLALVQAGAKTQTSDEIGRALNLPEDKTKTQQGFHKLMQSLNNADKVTLDIANKVYIAKGFQIASGFKEIATNNFDAGIDNVDFARSAEAAQTINQWVEEKTNEKIKNLIKPNDLNALTRMVLVNALYFKGTWKNTFDNYMTRKRDFYLNEHDTVQVNMMHQTEWFNYAENAALDCKFLEMPYVGDEFVMTIVLPNKKDGLAALENKMAEVLAPQNYKKERVDVMMPKFSVEETIQFKEVLQRLGMVVPFTDAADFSGLSETGEALTISKVIQKNFINVTESGTEAASATAVGIVTLSLPSFTEPAKIFKAEQPFIYTLRTRQGNTLLFVGRYSQPQLH